MSVPNEVMAAAASALRRPVEHLEAFPHHTQFLTGWSFWLVGDGSLPPSEVYVGFRAGEAEVARFDDGFEPFVRETRLDLANADEATAYIRMFVTLTQPGRNIIEDLDDIVGLVDEVATDLVTEVLPPSAEVVVSGGWQVTAFLNELDELDRAVFAIAPSGQISVSTQRLAEGISIFGTWE